MIKHAHTDYYPVISDINNWHMWMNLEKVLR